MTNPTLIALVRSGEGGEAKFIKTTDYPSKDAARAGLREHGLVAEQVAEEGARPVFFARISGGSVTKQLLTDEFLDEGHARDVLGKRGWTVEDIGPPPPPGTIEGLSDIPDIAITTAPWLPGHPDAPSVGIVSAECVFGQNVFKDIGAGLRNFFGGRSGMMQETLRDARNLVLDELKREAARIGADAVVAVDLRYQTVGGASGGDMIMAYAVGTAVRVKQEGADAAAA